MATVPFSTPIGATCYVEPQPPPPPPPPTPDPPDPVVEPPPVVPPPTPDPVIIGEVIYVSTINIAWQRGKVYQLLTGNYGTLQFGPGEASSNFVEIRGGNGVTVQGVAASKSYLKLTNLAIANTRAATDTPYLLDLQPNVGYITLTDCTLYRPSNRYLGRGVYATRGGNHHLTFTRTTFRDMWGPFYYGIFDSDILFDGCSFLRNYSDPTTHSEGIDLNASTRVTIKNCYFLDNNGTAFIVTLNRPSTYLYIFNNVFRHTWGAANSTGHGTISDNTEAAKSATSHHVYVHHNTFVDVAQYSGRSGITFWFGEDVVARNNLFYRCKKLAMLGVDDDYSAVFSCPASAEYTPATNDVAYARDPFADADFRPDAEDGCVAGVALDAAYNKDKDGRTRTRWYRGAYEGPAA